MWIFTLFFGHQLCPVNHFLKALNKETFSCSLALCHDGDAARWGPHPYPSVTHGGGTMGILLTLCVFTEKKTCPSGYILDKTAPRTSSGTGHQAHGGDDNAHFRSQELATVSRCQHSGSHGACLWAFLLCWNFHWELARLFGQGQLHWLPAVAVLDTHSDGRQQVDHSQQGEVAKIHIKLQKRREGRTALGALPSSHTIQERPPP